MTRNAELDQKFSSADLWVEEAHALRQVLLGCGLTETIKWNKPCYVNGENNICIIQRMKGFLSLMFFKGALLKDPDGLLKSQGENSRSAMRVEMTSLSDVHDNARAIADLISEAIDVENKGLKVESHPNMDCPDELVDAFDEDPDFRTAFEDLTPGRQRAYLLQFNGAKQSSTRAARIAKHRERILAGKGLMDR